MVAYEFIFIQIVKIQSEFSVQTTFKNTFLTENHYKTLNQKLKTSQNFFKLRHAVCMCVPLGNQGN